MIRRAVRVVCEEALWAHCEFVSDADFSRLIAMGDSRLQPLRPAFGHDLVDPRAHRARSPMWLMGTINANVILPRRIRAFAADHPERREFVRMRIAAGDGRFARARKAIRVDDPILRIDIDGEADFLLAEKILERGLFVQETAVLQAVRA